MSTLFIVLILEGCLRRFEIFLKCVDEIWDTFRIEVLKKYVLILFVSFFLLGLQLILIVPTDERKFQKGQHLKPNNHVSIGKKD